MLGDHNSDDAVSPNLYIPFPGVIALTANTKYALALRPTTANTGLTQISYNVDVAGHFDLHSGGQNVYQGTRQNQTGAFSTTLTRRPFFAVALCGFDDATGGGGVVIPRGANTLLRM